MSKAKTIFERGEEALTSGTAAECTALIGEVGTVLRKEFAELEAIRPPQQSTQFGPDGTAIGTYTAEAGADFQEAALAGDATRLEKMQLRYSQLNVRTDALETLLHRLKGRQTTARDQERRAAAPAKAKKLAKKLEAAADELEAAAAEYKAARETAEQALRDLVEQRALLTEDDRSGVIEIATFRRLGLRLAVIEKPILNDHGGVELFGSQQTAMRYSRALLPVTETGFKGLIRKLAPNPAFMMGTSQLSDHHERGGPSSDSIREALTDFHRERLRLLANGNLEAAERLEAPQNVA